MLSDAPGEMEIVDKFSRHFDEHVQQAVLTQRITRIDELIELLDIQDRMGTLNAFRNGVRYEDIRSPSYARRKPLTDVTRRSNNSLNARPNNSVYNTPNHLSSFRSSTPMPRSESRSRERPVTFNTPDRPRNTPIREAVNEIEVTEEPELAEQPELYNPEN